MNFKMLTVLFIIINWITGISTIVSFIIYLFKDVQFAWWTIWAFALSVTMTILCAWLSFNQIKNSAKGKKLTKSKFQSKLEKMAKEHKH